jgi:hypothetical protein
MSHWSRLRFHGPRQAYLAALALSLLVSVPISAAPLPQKLLIACDEGYPPYTYLDGKGNLRGIVPDQ